MFKQLLSRLVVKGKLAVAMPNGEWLAIGVTRPEAAGLAIHIHDWRTVRRIVRNPALAVGEAYVDGTLTIERGDLYDLLALATHTLGRLRRRRRAMANGHRRSKRNVAHHYDLSGELYRLFLDADRQYSCAYFAYPGMSLEAAQAAKKRHIAAKLSLEPGQRVLDIGAGWGGMALTLAEEYGAETLGITLSQEQLDEACKRAGERGLAHKARFELKDYRDLDGLFDRIVSVGMFEHVGPKDYDTFFATVARCLAEDGVAVVHTIGTCAGPAPNNPWIEKHIFPGGAIPALSQIAPAIEQSGLILTDVEVLRFHYADTLRAWRERFALNRVRIAELYDERFCRMWEFYLAGAEAGFREGSLVVFQLQLAKHRASVPITRDYIHDFERTGSPLAVAAE